MRKEIAYEYKRAKEWWFSIPHFEPSELHHVYGRNGSLVACRVFYVALDKTGHNNPTILRMLRDGYREQKLKYDKSHGKGGCIYPISELCKDCSLLLPQEEIR